MGQHVQPEMYLNSPVWTSGHEFSVRQATAQRPASATIYILTSVCCAFVPLAPFVAFSFAHYLEKKNI